jgi:hypothetical protein
MNEHMKAISPRFGFCYEDLPPKTFKLYSKKEYGMILDCVYEMAEQIATSNGWVVGFAIDQLLNDKGWEVLPAHLTAIRNRIADDRIALIFEDIDKQELA